MSQRAQCYELLLDNCGLINDPDRPKCGKHRDVYPAEIKKSENAVKKIITAVKNFMNPFNVVDKDQLYSIASGAPMKADVERDVLMAESFGNIAKKTFIEDRFIKKELGFFDPVKRIKLLTMEANNKKVALTTSQGKIVQYQEQSNIAFQLLVKSQVSDNPISLSELCKYPLSPVCHSLATPDGYFAKTNKAALMHVLLEDCDDPDPATRAFHIEDGNALWHSLVQVPLTFREICLKLLDIMVPKKHFLFSTDSYCKDSIKSQERLRRGSSTKLIIEGPATLRPENF